ncbi:TetR/AcrR family transcriptional regulator C-terminal domain-containing protein [Nonomuraea sp. NPDC005983]|uniref:TetR/AcrR family transcriptional regulator C-terminal domain-containing protein n=1 Tax=Nonomuraea sp. NPDC005983 TaxID=3155595 RepID=UPI0033AFA999
MRLHCDDRSGALRRLLYSESTRFPDVLDIVRQSGPHRLNQALADRLARLPDVAGGRRASPPRPEYSATGRGDAGDPGGELGQARERGVR